MNITTLPIYLKIFPTPPPKKKHLIFQWLKIFYAFFLHKQGIDLYLLLNLHYVYEKLFWHKQGA